MGQQKDSKKIDFAQLNSNLLAQSETLLPQWLPGGKINGHEFEASSINGGQGKSLKVNLRTGQWKDFATGTDYGKDLVGLYASIKGLSQAQAAQELQNGSANMGANVLKPKPEKPTETLTPPPDDTPPPDMKHPTLGDPSKHWVYRSTNGKALFFIARYETRKGKELRPWSWSQDKKQWTPKMWPGVRPMFGLENLKQGKVVVLVEGEKACEHLQKVVGDKYSVLSWSGGSAAWKKTDFSPLNGADCILWPDADPAGLDAMLAIKKHIGKTTKTTKVIEVKGKPTGWDAADASVDETWAILESVQAVDNPVDNVDNFASCLEAGFYTELQLPNGGTRAVPCYQQMADYFKQVLNLKTFEHCNYIFDQTHYRKIGELELKSRIHGLALQKTTSTNQLNNFKTVVLSTCFAGQREPQVPEKTLNLANGVLDLKKRTLQNHTPNLFFKSVVPVQYDPTATADRWDKFLWTVFCGDLELISLAQQMFGYCLLGGDPFLHSAFFLLGSGRNGKGVFTEVLSHLVGKDNVVTVPIDKLEDKFSAVLLDGALLNNISEQGRKLDGLIQSDAFKAAVGGDTLLVSQKGKPEYGLKVQARFVVSCNTLPKFDDDSHGLFDRIVILPFKRYFEAEERDHGLKAVLLGELSGILNWALDGADMVLRNGVVLRPQASVDALNEYRKESDSVYGWCSDYLTQGEEFLPMDVVYKAYKLDLQFNGRKPVSFISFSRRFGLWNKSNTIQKKLDPKNRRATLAAHCSSPSLHKARLEHTYTTNH
jgi:P4 family phage/plasmid primase-like protien